MSEQEPFMNLDTGDGEKIRCTAENTVLYTFMGHTAIGSLLIENSAVNHVYVRLEQEDEDGDPLAMYFFEKFHKPYQEMARFIQQNDFPMVLNGRNLAECDVRAYLNQVDKTTAEFSSTIPDELPLDFE